MFVLWNLGLLVFGFLFGDGSVEVGWGVFGTCTGESSCVEELDRRRESLASLEFFFCCFSDFGAVRWRRGCWKIRRSLCGGVAMVFVSVACRSGFTDQENNDEGYGECDCRESYDGDANK